MPERVLVSSAEFIRSVGYWQNEALKRPVVITHHGRERLVLTAPENADLVAQLKTAADNLDTVGADTRELRSIIARHFN